MARYYLLVSAFWLVIPGVLAQQEATCNSTLGFSWAFNSQKQSPCEIATALAAPCYGGSFPIPPIRPDQFYGSVRADQQSKCRCNTVFFNALSACAACQGAQLITWTAFNANCSTVYPGLYPDALPVPVPAYAYQDLSKTNQFDVNAAKAQQQSGSAVESIASSQATSTSVSQPSVSIAPASSQPSSGKKVNAGAIAGGTVGGIIGAALIGFGIWLFLRQRRRQKLAKREAILGEPKSFYGTDPHSPPFAGYGLPNSPSARSTDGDATYGTSMQPYMGDHSMDGQTNYHSSATQGHGYSLERRPSSPEI